MAVSERLFSAGVGRTDKAIVCGANNRFRIPGKMLSFND